MCLLREAILNIGEVTFAASLLHTFGSPEENTVV